MKENNLMNYGVEIPLHERSIFSSIVPNERQDHRHFVDLIAQGPENEEFKILDISQGGLRILAPVLLWPGNTITLYLNHKGKRIQAKCEVLSFVHTADGVAMRLCYVNKTKALTAFLTKLLPILH